ncbi:hypothetical protein [Butyrivibrio sp. NC3005]|uniref:hypothetical protein n=1 Tax=Butyrivibrio sp. NC3005 TaxID=1280685 RepID=UPI0003FB1DD3|nr:hypothetical protein [Butyrivibrio sp. NC3005]
MVSYICVQGDDGTSRTYYCLNEEGTAWLELDPTTGCYNKLFGVSYGAIMLMARRNGMKFETSADI